MEDRIIGIDAGNEISGIVVLDGMRIRHAGTPDNESLFNTIGNYSVHKRLTIVIEDVRPYSLQLTPQVIDTCKFIGELTYRLKAYAGLPVELVSRFEVRKWIYDKFPEVSGPLIDAKIEKKMYDACDVATKALIRVDAAGRPKRKASFIYVDDNVVKESMRVMYKIPDHKAGKGYMHGLQKHSWQALGVASYFMTKGNI